MSVLFDTVSICIRAYNDSCGLSFGSRDATWTSPSELRDDVLPELRGSAWTFPPELRDDAAMFHIKVDNGSSIHEEREALTRVEKARATQKSNILLFLVRN